MKKNGKDYYEKRQRQIFLVRIFRSFDCGQEEDIRDPLDDVSDVGHPGSATFSNSCLMALFNLDSSFGGFAESFFLTEPLLLEGKAKLSRLVSPPEIGITISMLSTIISGSFGISIGCRMSSGMSNKLFAFLPFRIIPSTAVKICIQWGGRAPPSGPLSLEGNVAQNGKLIVLFRDLFHFGSWKEFEV